MHFYGIYCLILLYILLIKNIFTNIPNIFYNIFDFYLIKI